MLQGDDGLENAAGHSINNVIVDTMVMIVRLAKIEKKCFQQSHIILPEHDLTIGKR